MSEPQPSQGPKKEDLEVTLPATSATGSRGPTPSGSSGPPGSHGSAHGSQSGGGGGVGSRAHVRVVLKHTVQELCEDKLVLAAKRVEYDARLVPSLGGIPLLAKLGQGGMGAVYYGLHPRLNKEVAVKVLPFNLVDRHPELIDRFFREAQLASNVQSPNLVTVTDVNEEAGLFYLVMEYVHGLTGGSYLREVCERGRIGLPEIEALEICIAATIGLAAAHDAAIIHRDVKPDNILIPRRVVSSHGLSTPAPGDTPAEYDFHRAKLSDLGLARTDELSQSLTGADLCMGTPGYMSPEQAMDAKTCGKPADIFSMGATLYAMLTGNAPFRESTLMRVLLATRNEPYPPIQSVRSDISTFTTDLIDRCLAKDAAQRFPDAQALLESMSACKRMIVRSTGASGKDTRTLIKEIARISLAPGEASKPIADTQSTFVGPQPTTSAPAGVSHAATVASQSAALTPTLIGPGQTPSTASQPATTVTTVVAAPVQTPPKLGRWIAAGLAAVVLLAVGGYAWHQHQVEAACIEKFRSDVAHAISDGKTALKKSDDLDKAMEAIEAVLDPQARHGEVDIKPAQEMLASLKTRHAALDKRKAEFDRLLAEAQKLRSAAPSQAMKSLIEADKLGSPDEEQGFPDIRTSIPMLKVDLRSSMDRREKKFEQNAEAAKKAKADQDWAKAQETAEQALKSLADIKHPDKAEVETLLKEAQDIRDAFAFNLNEGERLLKEKDLAGAKAAFEKAKAAWPKSPDIGKVEEGLAATNK